MDRRRNWDQARQWGYHRGREVGARQQPYAYRPWSQSSMRNDQRQPFRSRPKNSHHNHNTHWRRDNHYDVDEARDLEEKRRTKTMVMQKLQTLTAEDKSKSMKQLLVDPAPDSSINQQVAHTQEIKEKEAKRVAHVKKPPRPAPPVQKQPKLVRINVNGLHDRSSQEKIKRKVFQDLLLRPVSDLKNLVINPGSGDNLCLSQLYKKTRASLSEAMRNLAERKLQNQIQTSSPPLLSELENLVDADIAVDVCNMPVETLQALQDIFNLDLDSDMFSPPLEDDPYGMQNSTDEDEPENKIEYSTFEIIKGEVGGISSNPFEISRMNSSLTSQISNKNDVKRSSASQLERSAITLCIENNSQIAAKSYEPQFLNHQSDCNVSGSHSVLTDSVDMHSSTVTVSSSAMGHETVLMSGVEASTVEGRNTAKPPENSSLIQSSTHGCFHNLPIQPLGAHRGPKGNSKDTANTSISIPVAGSTITTNTTSVAVPANCVTSTTMSGSTKTTTLPTSTMNSIDYFVSMSQINKYRLDEIPVQAFGLARVTEPSQSQVGLISKVHHQEIVKPKTPSPILQSSDTAARKFQRVDVSPQLIVSENNGNRGSDTTTRKLQQVNVSSLSAIPEKNAARGSDTTARKLQQVDVSSNSRSNSAQSADTDARKFRQVEANSATPTRSDGRASETPVRNVQQRDVSVSNSNRSSETLTKKLQQVDVSSNSRSNSARSADTDARKFQQVEANSATPASNGGGASDTPIRNVKQIDVSVSNSNRSSDTLTRKLQQVDVSSNSRSNSARSADTDARKFPQVEANLATPASNGGRASDTPIRNVQQIDASESNSNRGSDATTRKLKQGDGSSHSTSSIARSSDTDTRKLQQETVSSHSRIPEKNDSRSSDTTTRKLQQGDDSSYSKNSSSRSSDTDTRKLQQVNVSCHLAIPQKNDGRGSDSTTKKMQQGYISPHSKINSDRSSDADRRKLLQVNSSSHSAIPKRTVDRFSETTTKSVQQVSISLHSKSNNALSPGADSRKLQQLDASSYCKSNGSRGSETRKLQQVDASQSTVPSSNNTGKGTAFHVNINPNDGLELGARSVAVQTQWSLGSNYVSIKKSCFEQIDNVSNENENTNASVSASSQISDPASTQDETCVVKEFQNFISDVRKLPSHSELRRKVTNHMIRVMTSSFNSCFSLFMGMEVHVPEEGITRKRKKRNKDSQSKKKKRNYYSQENSNNSYVQPLCQPIVGDSILVQPLQETISSSPTVNPTACKSSSPLVLSITCPKNDTNVLSMPVL